MSGAMKLIYTFRGKPTPRRWCNISQPRQKFYRPALLAKRRQAPVLLRRVK